MQEDFWTLFFMIYFYITPDQRAAELLMSTALKAESPCRKSPLLSCPCRKSSLWYTFCMNKSQNTYSHMMLNKYGDVNSHLAGNSIDYLYIVHCTLCSLYMNRWPVNSRNKGLVRISIKVTITHASTNTGESHAIYGKKFRFLTNFFIYYSIMVKFDKNRRKYDCKDAIFVIHYSTYCLIPEHNPLESITKNTIFFMNDNGIQFPQNLYNYVCDRLWAMTNGWGHWWEVNYLYTQVPKVCQLIIPI